MPLLRSLVVTPSFVTTRRSISYTSVVQYDAGGPAHVYDRSDRPNYSFELTLEPLKRHELEYLYGFHSFHRGGRSFLWDGGPYGTVQNYTLFGEGNSSRREFFVPNRYVGAGSFSLQTQNQATLATSNWATTAYSLTPDPGIVTFNNSFIS